MSQTYWSFFHAKELQGNGHEEENTFRTEEILHQEDENKD